MEDVTDAAFRRVIASYSNAKIPRVIYTEFTSADGLILADENGKKKLARKLLYADIERPIVAQLFTSSPERMEKAAGLCKEMGFDGFDINMGCPVNEVVRQQCGAALIQNPPLARELIRAGKRGFEGPVSVKTRIGYNTDELETWLPELLAENPAAIALHARTRKEMSDVPAHWDRIARAVEIRNDAQSSTSHKTLIVGNGDVGHLTDAREKIAQAKCDGVMIGRAAFGNPWIFSDRAGDPSPRERLEALARHIELFDELLGGVTNFAVMKKHFKAYASGWDGAKDLRVQLMAAESTREALDVIARHVTERIF